MPTKTITPLYFAEGYSRSWLDHEKNVIVVKVFNLNLDFHRQKAFEVNIAAIEKYNTKTAIIDAYEATGHHHPSDLDWIVDIALPGYKARGIQLFIYIFPDNFIAKLGARTWLEMAQKFGFDFAQANSLNEAYDLARSREFH